MARKKIKKRVSREPSKVIKNIKENGTKYTIILVIFFMLLIGFVGYNLITVTNDELYTDYKIASSMDDYLSLSSNNITLTNKNVISDEEGLKSNKYSIHIENNTNKVKQYKIYFVSDYKDKCKCGNKLFDKSSIRYSINKKDVLTLKNDNLFIDGILKKNESKDIVFNMWISNKTNTEEELHYHGHFIIK